MISRVLVIGALLLASCGHSSDGVTRADSDMTSESAAPVEAEIEAEALSLLAPHVQPASIDEACSSFLVALDDLWNRRGMEVGNSLAYLRAQTITLERLLTYARTTGDAGAEAADRLSSLDDLVPELRRSADDAGNDPDPSVSASSALTDFGTVLADAGHERCDALGEGWNGVWPRVSGAEAVLDALNGAKALWDKHGHTHYTVQVGHEYFSVTRTTLIASVEDGVATKVLELTGCAATPTSVDLPVSVEDLFALIDTHAPSATVAFGPGRGIPAVIVVESERQRFSVSVSTLPLADVLEACFVPTL